MAPSQNAARGPSATAKAPTRRTSRLRHKHRFWPSPIPSVITVGTRQKGMSKSQHGKEGAGKAGESPGDKHQAGTGNWLKHKGKDNCRQLPNLYGHNLAACCRRAPAQLGKPGAGVCPPDPTQPPLSPATLDCRQPGQTLPLHHFQTFGMGPRQSQPRGEQLALPLTRSA